MKVLTPHDIHSPEDLDDVLATTGSRGIDVLEGQRKLLSSALKRKFEEEVEPGGDLGLDQTPGPLETIKDPARIYLREMGAVPLLTRRMRKMVADFPINKATIHRQGLASRH